VEDGADADALRAVPSLLADMPFGAHVGTFVHGVFEATDFAAADLEAELGRRIDEVQARRAIDIGDRGVVLTGLGAVIETPLGPLLGGARLRDVARADRLDELDFELPLAGGDIPSGRVDLAAIGAVLRDDPDLASYAERLEDPALRSRFRGYLTGSVDLVVRRGDRFAVVDYKTNWLGAPGEELTAWHHRPAALATEMQHAHYALQALLYTAALHRYLRWRLPGYDPEVNLAGVLYLFLRGMVGPDTPAVDGTPAGVFAWRPPSALVVALSDVLDRGDGA
jgi:exodeoxyribonuclease V beta subunit